MTKQIPPGYKQTKVGVVPNDWTEPCLYQYIREITTYCNDENIPLYSLTIESGIIPKPERYEREHLVRNTNDAYKLIKFNQFAYNPMNLRFGALALFKDKLNVKLSAYYNIFEVNEDIVNIQYIYYYLKSIRIMFYFNRMAIGSLEEKKRIHFSDFIKFSFPIPQLKEQEKIAEILSTWDDAITKQEQLIAQKQVFKKGIMQQIFSQQIRFKDDHGNDYPTWQTKKLGEALFFIRNNSFSRNQLNLNNGLAQNLHYGDIHTKFSNYIDVANSVIPYINADVDIEPIQNHEYCQDGDLIIADASEDYKDVGKSVEIKNIGTKKILSGLHTILARNKISFALGFKAYLMQSTKMRSQIEKIANGISVLGISKTNLANTLLDYPCLEEQTKIADFLTNIDNGITKQTEILDQLKLQKQSLMQKLLSGQVRVINKGN